MTDEAKSPETTPERPTEQPPKPKVGTFHPFTNLPPRDGEEISTHGAKTGDLEKRKK
jgi:hypothetical protein